MTISEETATLNTATGEVSHAVTEKEIIQLPLITRNPYALVALTPGASDTGAVTGDMRGLGLAVAGQRTSSVNFMLDGGANNETFAAGVGQTAPLDAVQEFRVQTNNMTAEFGRNAIVTNAITKSGTNRYHGSATSSTGARASRRRPSTTMPTGCRRATLCATSSAARWAGRS